MLSTPETINQVLSIDFMSEAYGVSSTFRQSIPMSVCALGGSIATGVLLSANVVEVKTWEELAALKDEDIKGRFV